MHDVTVIGAGPAGSTAALLLARGGTRVTLVEQHRFPRDKVCGECLSSLGFDVLRRAGAAERFLAAGAVRLTHTALHPPAGDSVRLALPHPMWGLSRGVLDRLLLDAAREAGVEVRQPARCESLQARPGDEDRGPARAIRESAGANDSAGASDTAATAPRVPVLRVRDLTSNAVETLTPSWVIVADGKAALCGPGGRTPTATGDFGIKAHFVGVDGPRNAIELFSCPSTYGGLAPVEGGRWNAAFSVPAAMLREHQGDVAALFARLAEANPTLRRRLARATRVGPWLASPLPRFAVTRHWPARVIPVGNAAAALEPIGGEGMGLALRSAELAAGALADPGGFRPAALARAYAALWRPRRAACRAAAKLASSGRIANLAAEVLRHNGRLGEFALGLIGKC